MSGVNSRKINTDNAAVIIVGSRVIRRNGLACTTPVAMPRTLSAIVRMMKLGRPEDRLLTRSRASTGRLAATISRCCSVKSSISSSSSTDVKSNITFVGAR